MKWLDVDEISELSTCSGRHTLLRAKLLWTISAVVLSVLGQVAARAEDDQLGVGLIGQYRDGSANQIRRVDTSLTFSWPHGQADQRLSPGALSVRWHGFLESDASGAYQLLAFGPGHFTVRVDGVTIIDEERAEPGWIEGKVVTLDYDLHEIQIDYSAQVTPARMGFYWKGPGFRIEPLAAPALQHDPATSLATSFARGRDLYSSLRCGACHRLHGEVPVLAAPALDQIGNSLKRKWLIDWLESNRQRDGEPLQPGIRRMPQFSLEDHERAALADYLLVRRNGAANEPSSAKVAQTSDDVGLGKELFDSLGCRACHSTGEPAELSMFAGGDLSAVAQKRPADFFRTWLTKPETTNRDHRMPVFDLQPEQVSQLTAFLASLDGVSDVASGDTDEDLGRSDTSQLELGRTLFEQRHCSACHRSPDVVDRSLDGIIKPLVPDAATNWQASCIGGTESVRRPAYALTDQDRQSLVEYLTDVTSTALRQTEQSGAQIMRELNCLGCHDRGQDAGLLKQLPHLLSTSTGLRGVADRIVPPSLNSIGDKLHTHALAAAVKRTKPLRRPWLRVQMPRFRLSEAELQELVEYLVSADRIPTRSEDSRSVDLPSTALTLAGSRLVTARGFGCISCHALGSSVPQDPAPGTRGPALDQITQQIRRSWFDRFVRQPARIVRRMEMPSIQAAVHGVLNDDLSSQLDALWHVLALDEFDPPPPDPVRTVRLSGDSASGERTRVLTDVLRTPQGTLTKPFIIGFINRHSIVYDLASARLVRWSLGDVADQRTEGKTWYWQVAGQPLFEQPALQPEIELMSLGRTLHPIASGQFLTEIDEWRHEPRGLSMSHRLMFDLADGTDQTLHVEQRWTAFEDQSIRGFKRDIHVRGLRSNQQLRFHMPHAAQAINASQDGKMLWRLRQLPGTSIELERPDTATLDASGSITLGADSSIDTDDLAAQIVIKYESSLPIDRYAVGDESAKASVSELAVVPGFRTRRIELGERLMPTSIAWMDDGTMVVSSLKGRIWSGRDSDQDQLEDDFAPLSDELAAPYGLHAADSYVDVINKSSLLRLHDQDHDGWAERSETIASGWGHTDDYHDWAVGLPRDAEGCYYVALPCQQDERSPAAAHLRGQILRLVPQIPTRQDPRRFQIQPWAAGQRFPMGLALNREGLLFATDNQGNYNPFNELNHIVQGRHYGFINRLDIDRPVAHELTEPAINIPHPWTRSVNGICFLEANNAALRARKSPWFGPFEGHLIGCEYDTRRLVRMSLKEVDGRFQGAVYPFSVLQSDEQLNMLGPICCTVSPDGFLYVGSIRDSGWGGANNIGEILQLTFQADQLPCGIREINAVRNGMRIDFTRPIDPARARATDNYTVSSYHRISTPAYGGEDHGRQTVQVVDVSVAADQRSVVLRLDKWSPNRVYDVRLRRLIDVGEFFPAEAYFTLNEMDGGE